MSNRYVCFVTKIEIKILINKVWSTDTSYKTDRRKLFSGLFGIFWKYDAFFVENVTMEPCAYKIQAKILLHPHDFRKKDDNLGFYIIIYINIIAPSNKRNIQI